MKRINTRRWLQRMGITWLAVGWVAMGQAAGTNSAPPSASLTPQEFQEKLKDMTPEERLAAIRARREQLAREAGQRPRLQQRPVEAKELTPAEAAARRQQMQARLEARIAELQKKKTAGTLTPLEENQLDKLRMVLRPTSEGFPGNARHGELRPPDPGAKPVRSPTNSAPAVP